MANPDINVKYVAELARLELPAEQFAAIEKDLSSIVDYIAELNEVDVTGVEPTAHAAALSNVWREDKAVDSGLRDAMLKNAPDLVNGCLVKVSKVLPGEESN